MAQGIVTTRDGAILEVRLDRPKANAIDLATSRIMGLTFRAFRDDDSLRVCILRAEGEKFFCPGWDLKAAANGEAPDVDYGVGGFGGLLWGLLVAITIWVSFPSQYVASSDRTEFPSRQLSTSVQSAVNQSRFAKPLFKKIYSDKFFSKAFFSTRR